MRKGLRLPLPRRNDPVLIEDELEFLRMLLINHIASAKHEMSQHLVSESVIRHKMYAEDVLAKIEQVLDL
jgi:hypothetical protein